MREKEWLEQSFDWVIDKLPPLRECGYEVVAATPFAAHCNQMGVWLWLASETPVGGNPCFCSLGAAYMEHGGFNVFEFGEMDEEERRESEDALVEAFGIEPEPGETWK